MAWTIKFTGRSLKQLRKIDPQDARRIRDFLRHRVATLDDPSLLANRLKGSETGLWRYRVGDYRVICEIQSEQVVVLVLRVGHRREIYDT